jgi:drug/metabolite transporter (DMT)-like permease
MKKSNSLKISPQFVLFLGILAASTASILIRFAQVEVPSLVIAAYRMVLAGLIVAPFAIPSHSNELKALGRKELWLAALSGFFLAVHFATWIQSLEYSSIASSVVIVTTSPLWLAILARFILGERMGQWTVVGLVVGLTGGILIGISDSCVQGTSGIVCPSFANYLQGENFLGNFLALIGAWTGAGYFLIGRYLRPKLSLNSYVFLVYGIAGALLAFAVIVSGLPIFGYSWQSYIWMLLLAVFPQILGHSSFNWALGHLPAVYISLPLLGDPIGAIILGVLLFDEIPGSLKLIGAALILGGILLGSREQSVE